MRISMAISTSLIIQSLLLLTFCQGILGATFTFVNKCDHTVWPGILGTPKLDSTGFELTKDTSRSFQAPTGWSGRFWGRTGCNFDDSGTGSCATADCGSGQMECNGGGAATPATLAEFTLGSGSQDFYDVSLVDGYNLPMLVDVSGGSGSQDFYDVSLVDGYNLPMLVDVSGGSGPCASTGCNVDLNQKCPTELRVEGGGACKSACDAFKTPQYCCAGAYASPATCSPSVYSQMFKSACPKSYSYAYDDATSTFTCSNANYIITFCPSSLPSKSASRSNGSTDESGTESGSGSLPNSESGSDSGSLPDSESGSGSGSMSQTMLADGSWLASLATGSSASTRPSRVIQFTTLMMAFVLFIGLVLKL